MTEVRDEDNALLKDRRAKKLAIFDSTMGGEIIKQADECLVEELTLVLWSIWSIAWSRPFTESHALRIVHCIANSTVDFSGFGVSKKEKSDEIG